MDFWTINTTRAFSHGHFGVHTAYIVIKLADSLKILAPQKAQTFKSTRSEPCLIPFFYQKSAHEKGAKNGRKKFFHWIRLRKVQNAF